MNTSTVCKFCDRQFTIKSNLKRHLREIHHHVDNGTPLPTSYPLNCAICKVAKFERFPDLESHLLDEHKLVLEKKILNFSNSTEFYNWKVSTEESQNALFVKKRGAKMLIDKSETCYFQCNRSGFSRCKLERKREVKVQGTCKIDAVCPARIKAVFLASGKVTVEFCETHIGHTSDLAHIPLTQKQRQDIADRIASKVPFDAILDDVRSTVPKDSLSRIHLLTKQDLYNIEKEFGLNESIRHPNDALSVEAWVQKEMSSQNNCVLFYKPQNEETTNFTKDDFCLGIMTESQQEILKKFGSDCICIDSTHGLGAYDFEVVTVMVIDDMRQGFPCAFFITNKTDKKPVSVFLEEIKRKVGPINPRVFMSDMAESFYNAWVSVMGPVENRLYCTWHIDRAWQKNLPKIKDSETQKETYKKLRVLLEETDANAFDLMLQHTVDQLCNDERTKEYGEYFRDQYQGCYKSWAYCHRLNLGINTNMHLESMHRTIKHYLLKGRTEKRLDKSISALMMMIKEKLFDRLIILEKGKVSSKLKDLRSRHKKSVGMNTDLIIQTSDTSWAVASSSSTEMYTIRLLENPCNCRLICTQCATCMHRYSCSCIDACIKWNMCKHVHLLCRKLISEKNNPKEISDSTIVQQDTNSGEKIAILSEVGAENVAFKSMEEEKLRLREQFEMTFKEINNAETLKIARQSLRNMHARIISSKHRHNIALKVKTKGVLNKKIEPQRRFYSTKKKNKKSLLRKKRPTTEEKQIIAIQALFASEKVPDPTPPTLN